VSDCSEAEVDAILEEVDKNGGWTGSRACYRRFCLARESAGAAPNLPPTVPATPRRTRPPAGDGQISYDEFVALMTGRQEQRFQPLTKRSESRGDLNAYKAAHNLGLAWG
jgi:hypothetical protein